MNSQHRWMYGDRSTIEFFNGVQQFCRVACEHQKMIGVATILCPCRDCNNIRKWDHIAIIEEHLLRRGFKQGYSSWFWHGESMEPLNLESVVANNEEDCDNNGGESGEDVSKHDEDACRNDEEDNDNGNEVNYQYDEVLETSDKVRR